MAAAIEAERREGRLERLRTEVVEERKAREEAEAARVGWAGSVFGDDAALEQVCRWTDCSFELCLHVLACDYRFALCMGTCLTLHAAPANAPGCRHPQVGALRGRAGGDAHRPGGTAGGMPGGGGGAGGLG